MTAKSLQFDLWEACWVQWRTVVQAKACCRLQRWYSKMHRWKALALSRFAWQSPTGLQHSTPSLWFTHTPNTVMEGHMAYWASLWYCSKIFPDELNSAASFSVALRLHEQDTAYPQEEPNWLFRLTFLSWDYGSCSHTCYVNLNLSPTFPEQKSY